MDKRHDFSIGRPVRISKALREELEAAIQAHLAAVEKLTAVLDKADGNPDLEPSLGYSPDDDREQDVVDEPHDEEAEGNNEASLAHTNDLNQETAQRHLRAVIGRNGLREMDQDFEAEHDGREPSLGAPERNFAGAYRSSFSQENWAAGGRDDREDDGDDREPDVDDEPKYLPAVTP